MRANQFWILLLCSTIVSALMIKQIFLSRALNIEQRLLVDSQEMASTGSAYETAWKQLAIRIYQAGHQDPALAEVLKKENVMIHSGAPSGSGSTPATTLPPSPAPPASSKVPSGPPHPATP